MEWQPIETAKASAPKGQHFIVFGPGRHVGNNEGFAYIIPDSIALARFRADDKEGWVLETSFEFRAPKATHWMRLPALPGEASNEQWICAARNANHGPHDPPECDWPQCGCDPYAAKVIAALWKSSTKTRRSCSSPTKPAMMSVKLMSGPNSNPAPPQPRQQSGN